ncbi:LemA family protein [Aliiglaciecola litoralis]|uniref:LemA family protein n=1 Tax=Aliiglaciecola litoralis TaxID=582857 RepID=A0ABP3WYU3_9ALTE
MEIAIIVVVVIIALWILIAYNEIVKKFNLVKRGWADVTAQERQKGRIIPELEKVLKDHKQFETDLLPKIVALRSGLSELNDAEVDPSKLKDITAASKELRSGLELTVEAYPELKASESFSNLMTQITNQEENVGAALRIFNQNVEIFNSTIQVFPNNLINSSLNKKKEIEVFTDSEASESFEYKPSF